MKEKIEVRQIIGVFCAVIVSGYLLGAAEAQAEPFKQTASGWLNRTAFDVDANGNPLSVVNTFGKGTFGKSTSNEVGENGPFAGEFCEFFPPEVVIVRIPMIARSIITRYTNGDMLFASLATDTPSSLCVDVNSRTVTSEIHWVITGGTGMFAGATGMLKTTRGDSTTVLREAGFPVHVAITRATEGEIILVGNNEDD